LFGLSAEHVRLGLAHDSLEAFLRIIKHLLGSACYHRLRRLLIIRLSNIRNSISKVELLHLLLGLRNNLPVLGRHYSKVVLLTAPGRA
jgi:hypothetical protein